VAGLNSWGAAMDNSKLRKRRLRARRQHAGLKAHLVWLSPAGQAALAALRQPARPTGTRDGTSPEADHGAQAGAALVALLTLLFPEGQPIYPRTRYGWQTFPLAQINRLLAPEGLVIRATKTRTPARAILCTDAYGGVERYGLFELRRIAEDDSR
jgi:hypothetical protein